MDDVYNVWSKKDEQAAWSSFSTLPTGDARSNALRGIINGVAGDNPKAAVSLMDRFPNDVNDRMVQHFVWRSFDSDPLTSINAIARMGDQQRRDAMYRRTFEAWQEQDPTSADTWLRQNSGSSAVFAPR